MTKPGNWGDWAVIERPKGGSIKKKISCELCSSYIKEKNKCIKYGECNKSEDWIKCEKFYFKVRYDTAKYWNLLEKCRKNLKK